MILLNPFLLIILHSCWEVCGKSLSHTTKYSNIFDEQFDYYVDVWKPLPESNSGSRSDVGNPKPTASFGESISKCFRDPLLTRRKSETLIDVISNWARYDPKVSKNLPAAVHSLKNLFELPLVDGIELANLRSTQTGVTCKTTPCGICTEVTSTGGIVQSPNFPFPYGHNMSCTFTIGVPSDKRIELTFTTFSVEPEYDFVSVYDQTSIPLRVNLNGFMTPKPIVSKTNLISISFKSDMDNTYMPSDTIARWEAKFNIYEDSHEPTSSATTTPSVDRPTVLCKSSHCDVCKNVSSSGGVIESPNYPDDYGSNQTFLLYLRAPPGKIIRLTFTDFLVAGDCDFFFVFDDIRFSVTNLLQGFLKGSTLPQPSVSQSNEMIVLFLTNEDNHSVLPYERPGRWQAKFEIEDPLLQSPSVVEGGENVDEVITDNEFIINESENMVEATNSSPFPDYFESSFSNLTSSPMVTTTSGDVTCSVTTCGICRDITMNGGIIQSPNYPNDYGNDRDCLLTIDVPVGFQIRLTFDTFFLEDCCDSISIYDGVFTAIQLQLNGHVNPPPSLTRTNQMNVRFISDFSNRLLIESGRWQARFDVVKSNLDYIRPTTTISTTTQIATTTTEPTTTSIKPTTTTTATSTERRNSTTTPPTTLSPIRVLCNMSACGMKIEITSYGGTIESPNYPQDYGNDLDCLITIEVPKGEKINFNFIDFMVEKDYDVISVFDRFSTPLKINLSGHLLPSAIKTKTNLMTVVFKTDSDNNALPQNISGRWKAMFSI